MYYGAALLILAILFNTAANTLFKFSSVEGGRAFIGIFTTGLMFGGLNAFLYTKSLATIDLNVAYAVFSAGSIVLITIAAGLFFKEVLAVKQVLGMGIILLGIVLLSAK
jgi:multidrug transporter EmrE-like cation transporter